MKWMTPFTSSEMMRFYLTILVSLNSKVVIKSQEKPSLKESHDQKHASWSSGGWHTKTEWQRTPKEVDAGAQSSQEQWSAQRPKDVMERSIPHRESTGIYGKRQEEHLGQKL